MQPQVRYSEDIDLVQINSEPINPILKRIREKLSFLGTKRTVKQHIHNNTIVYRFDSEIQTGHQHAIKNRNQHQGAFQCFGIKKTSPIKLKTHGFPANVT